MAAMKMKRSKSKRAKKWQNGKIGIMRRRSGTQFRATRLLQAATCRCQQGGLGATGAGHEAKYWEAQPTAAEAAMPSTATHKSECKVKDRRNIIAQITSTTMTCNGNGRISWHRIIHYLQSSQYNDLIFPPWAWTIDLLRSTCVISNFLILNACSLSKSNEEVTEQQSHQLWFQN